MGVREDDLFAKVGRKFGSITILGVLPNKRFLGLCDCGVTRPFIRASLYNGRTKSCGCLAKESITTHGMTKSSEYQSWRSMKKRCLDPKNKQYPDYGGRGISIYKEWIDSFEEFFAYLGSKPTKSHTLDRINNNGNYEPGNVRWATKKQQSQNRRTSVWIRYKDRVMTLTDWANEFGVHYRALANMLKRKSFEKCVEHYSQQKLSYGRRAIIKSHFEVAKK